MTTIALIGAGVIGGVHARLIDSIPDLDLVAVIDSQLERAEKLALPRGGRGVTSLAELHDAGIVPEVVVICTVSAGHAQLATEALAYGCHVLIEKPVDISLDAADRLARAAASSNRAVGVISQRRFLPTSQALRAAIDEGTLGSLTGGTVESPFFRGQDYYDSGDWRGTKEFDGGGALMNQGIHALDLMLWFLGEPQRITALSGIVAHERIEVEDVVGAALAFESGAIGSAFASTAAFPQGDVRVSVYGTAGSATITAGRLTIRTADAEIIVDDSAPDGWTDVDWAHRAQYLDFLQAIATSTAPAIGLADGRRALASVLAIYESAATGATVSVSPAAL